MSGTAYCPGLPLSFLVMLWAAQTCLGVFPLFQGGSEAWDYALRPADCRHLSSLFRVTSFPGQPLLVSQFRRGSFGGRGPLLEGQTKANCHHELVIHQLRDWAPPSIVAVLSSGTQDGGA